MSLFSVIHTVLVSLGLCSIVLYSLRKVSDSVSEALTTMRLCSVGHEQTEPTVNGISLELLLLHLAGPSPPKPRGLRGKESLLRVPRLSGLATGPPATRCSPNEKQESPLLFQVGTLVFQQDQSCGGVLVFTALMTMSTGTRKMLPLLGKY